MRIGRPRRGLTQRKRESLLVAFDVWCVKQRTRITALAPACGEHEDGGQHPLGPCGRPILPPQHYTMEVRS